VRSINVASNLMVPDLCGGIDIRLWTLTRRSSYVNSTFGISLFFIVNAVEFCAGTLSYSLCHLGDEPAIDVKN
jgi:hypothetical protein